MIVERYIFPNMTLAPSAWPFTRPRGRIAPDMDSAWTALALTLTVAGWATLLNLFLGVGAGCAMARWRYPGRELADALLTHARAATRHPMSWDIDLVERWI
jgi:ABC-type spermidine/putrescine transport system permease subunit II